MSDMTEILSAIEQGDRTATDELLPLVYDELCKATALVHQAYLRLVDFDNSKQWDSGGRFFAAAAKKRGEY